MTEQKKARKRIRKRRTIEDDKKEIELIDEMMKEIDRERTRTLVQ